MLVCKVWFGKFSKVCFSSFFCIFLWEYFGKIDRMGIMVFLRVFKWFWFRFFLNHWLGWIC